MIATATVNLGRPLGQRTLHLVRRQPAEARGDTDSERGGTDSDSDEDEGPSPPPAPYLGALVGFEEVRTVFFLDTKSPLYVKSKETVRKAVLTHVLAVGEECCHVEVTTDPAIVNLLKNARVVGSQSPNKVMLLSLSALVGVLESRQAPYEVVEAVRGIDEEQLFWGVMLGGAE